MDIINLGWIAIYIWMIVIPFKEGEIMWAAFAFFFPPSFLLFAYFHGWGKAKGPILSFIGLFLVTVIVNFSAL